MQRNAVWTHHDRCGNRGWRGSWSDCGRRVRADGFAGSASANHKRNRKQDQDDGKAMVVGEEFQFVDSFKTLHQGTASLQKLKTHYELLEHLRHSNPSCPDTDSCGLAVVTDTVRVLFFYLEKLCAVRLRELHDVQIFATSQIAGLAPAPVYCAPR